jgi:hypothetical protein
MEEGESVAGQDGRTLDTFASAGNNPPRNQVKEQYSMTIYKINISDTTQGTTDILCLNLFYRNTKKI